MTVYWRVEPDTKFPEDRIDEVRVGHGFVSGYLDASDDAAVVSLGIVEQVRPELVISWRPVTLTLFPSPRGIPKWKNMPVFKFPKDRAAAYRLDDHFAAAFDPSPMVTVNVSDLSAVRVPPTKPRASGVTNPGRS
jgi:hypothetical protein